MKFARFQLDPEPIDKDNEVWIYFGIASYYAQVLEKGLIQFIIFLKLIGLSEIKPEITEQIFGIFKKQTMGQLLCEVRKKTNIPIHIDELLSKSLEKRNFLAHRFFDHYALDHLNKEGRAKMVDELQQIIALFKHVDQELNKIFLTLIEHFGITNETIEAEYQSLLNEYDDEYKNI